MKPFLIDNDKVYTYQDLLDAIQTDGFYYPYYKVHDVFLYFVNLVKALANNQSLVLLDSDLNSSEIGYGTFVYTLFVDGKKADTLKKFIN